VHLKESVIDQAFLAALPLALAACTTTGPDAGRAPEQGTVSTSAHSLVLARQAAMHMLATLIVRGIRAALRNRTDIAEQEAAAEGLAMWAEAIPGLFPPGSAAAESRASPAIWSNMAEFDARAQRYRQAALHLAELARAVDAEGPPRRSRSSKASATAAINDFAGKRTAVLLPAPTSDRRDRYRGAIVSPAGARSSTCSSW
jgi:cytochrome c556